MLLFSFDSGIQPDRDYFIKDKLDLFEFLSHCIVQVGQWEKVPGRRQSSDLFIYFRITLKSVQAVGKLGHNMIIVYSTTTL